MGDMYNATTEEEDFMACDDSDNPPDLFTNQTTMRSGDLVTNFNILPYPIFAYVSIVVVLGSLGNILSGLVMLQSKFRSTSTGTYLLALSVVDTGQLLQNTLTRRWLGMVTGVQITQLSILSCQMYSYFFFWMHFMSSWTVVFVSAERVVAVAFPLKAKIWLTKTKSWIAMMSLILTAFVLGTPIATTHTLIPATNRSRPICDYYKDQGLNTAIVNMLIFIINIILPSVLLIGCSITLAVKLSESNRFRSTSNTTSADNKMVKLTIIVLANSVVFLALTLPATILDLWTYTTGGNPKLYVLWLSLKCLQVTNSGINWVVYMLSGPMFRSEMVKMLKCCFLFCPKRTGEKDSSDRVSTNKEMSSSNQSVTCTTPINNEPWGLI